MNCKYCGEAIIPCPKQPCGLGEYLHGESGLHRCNQGLTATPEPVAPAPTASADNEALKLAQSRAHFDVAAMTGAEVLAEKLAGVGQQAAEEIVAEYDLDGAREMAAIIDRVIAGRVKP